MSNRSNQWLGKTLLFVWGVALITVGIATKQTWVASIGSSFLVAMVA